MEGLPAGGKGEGGLQLGPLCDGREARYPACYSSNTKKSRTSFFVAVRSAKLSRPGASGAGKWTIAVINMAVVVQSTTATTQKPIAMPPRPFDSSAKWQHGKGH